MNEVVAKTEIAPGTFQIHVRAPEIAARRKAGQFVVLRVHEQGERFPLTIVSSDPDEGTIEMVFQVVGTSTTILAEHEVGDEILDLAGPLGNPTHIENFGRCVVIGGGYGMAPCIPIATALREAGNTLIGINGARSRENVILVDRLEELCERVEICTDDGSYGRKGFVTDALAEIMAADEPIDLVFAVGPTPMMRAVANLTREPGIKTIASLNPIMVDGTGMCGGCRVEVGGVTKFACVDGPEFDAHLVDFDMLMRRQRMFQGSRGEAAQAHHCRIGGGKE